MHLASATIDDLVHIAQSKLDDTALTELLLKRADAGLYITRVGPHVILGRDIERFHAAFDSVEDTVPSTEIDKMTGGRGLGVCWDVLKAMEAGDTCQAVFALGASGSGKTHTAREMIRCFTTTPTRDSGQQATLDQIFRLLRMFTTASTLENKQSSRAGTNIQLSFCLDPAIGRYVVSRAHVSIFSLQLTAMVQGDRAKAFHILRTIPFLADHYDGLALADLELDQGDSLDDPFVRDMVEQAHGLLSWMKDCWGPHLVSGMVAVLAGILHLDTLGPAFDEGEVGAGIRRDVLCADPRLVRACTCWQMEPGELTTRLLGEDKDIVQWTAVRAMGQSMYTVMLQVLLLRCNVELGTTMPAPGQEVRIVQVFDMAGFEKFETNNLDTFLINYMNEVLNLSKLSWIQDHLLPSGTERSELPVDCRSLNSTEALLDAVRVANNYPFLPEDTLVQVAAQQHLDHLRSAASWPLHDLQHHTAVVQYDLNRLIHEDKLCTTPPIIEAVLCCQPLARWSPGGWSRAFAKLMDEAGLAAFASRSVEDFAGVLERCIDASDKAWFVHCLRPSFGNHDDNARLPNSVVAITNQIQVSSIGPLIAMLGILPEDEDGQAEDDDDAFADYSFASDLSIATGRESLYGEKRDKEEAMHKLNTRLGLAGKQIADLTDKVESHNRDRVLWDEEAARLEREHQAEVDRLKAERRELESRLVNVTAQKETLSMDLQKTKADAERETKELDLGLRNVRAELRAVNAEKETLSVELRETQTRAEKERIHAARRYIKTHCELLWINPAETIEAWDRATLTSRRDKIKQERDQLAMSLSVKASATPLTGVDHMLHTIALAIAKKGNITSHVLPLYCVLASLDGQPLGDDTPPLSALAHAILERFPREFADSAFSARNKHLLTAGELRSRIVRLLVPILAWFGAAAPAVATRLLKEPVRRLLEQLHDRQKELPALKPDQVRMELELLEEQEDFGFLARDGWFDHIW